MPETLLQGPLCASSKIYPTSNSSISTFFTLNFVINIFLEIYVLTISKSMLPDVACCDESKYRSLVERSYGVIAYHHLQQFSVSHLRQGLNPGNTRFSWVNPCSPHHFVAANTDVSVNVCKSMSLLMYSPCMQWVYDILCTWDCVWWSINNGVAKIRIE